MDVEISTGQWVAAGIFAAILLLEAVFPFRVYLRRVRHFGKNVVFSLINTVVLTLFGATLNVWLFLWIDENQIGLVNQFELPFWQAALLASLLFDAWIYAWHRLNHVVPFLWRFHQVHHSDLNLDMSTSFRFHPGEILLSSIANLFVFAALGITIELILVYKTVFTFTVLFHHSNVALSERWDTVFRWIFVSPRMHRVHHSSKKIETNSNYSSVLSIWDRIFGSYRKRYPESIVFGLEYDREEKDQRLGRLLARPFTKQKREDRG